MKKRLQDWIQKLVPGDQFVKLAFNHYEVRAFSNVPPNYLGISSILCGEEGTSPERGTGEFNPSTLKLQTS